MKNGGSANRAKKIILNILIAICAVVFLVSAWYLGSYLLESKKSEDAFDRLRYTPPTRQQEETDDYAARQAYYRSLHEKNGDFVGWLRVYRMSIDYPVMQTPKNQDYYIHRNFEKDYAAAGTLFASAISDLQKPSDAIILYGHKMKNGTMFGKLSNLEKKDFYRDHRYIQLDTLTARHSYEIFCVFKTVVDTGRQSEFKYYGYADFADEADFNGLMDGARQREFFDTGVKAQYGDKILMLSTCEYSQKNGRLVVLAKEIPNDEAPRFD
jgi:sortase B